MTSDPDIAAVVDVKRLRVVAGILQEHALQALMGDLPAVT